MSYPLQGRSRIMLGDETLEKLVFSEIVYVDGKGQSKLEAKVPFKANVQPLKGRDLLLVPEHQRYKEQYYCFVPEQKDPLSTRIEFKSGEKTGDIVHRKGVHYQVQEIEFWGSYQKLRIMRVDVGYEATP